MSVEEVVMTEKTAVGEAHSKLILVGEHAVVHGQPAIALPFPLIKVASTVTYAKGPVYLKSDLYEGPLAAAPAALAGVQQIVKKALAILDLPFQDLVIQIDSTIPPGKGLGSSASVAIAIVKSLFHYKGKPYTTELLLDLANISETYAHGAPSGIDSLTITSSSPVWYEKDKAIDYVKPNGDFYFVVADTGQMADTKSAIATVTSLFKATPQIMHEAVEKIGDITHQVKDALEKSSKNMLGRLLNEAQKELETIGVSDESLNRLIQFAREQGALGAKLTGGGKGGCIIALAKNEIHSKQLSEKLLEYGAQAVWPFVLKSEKQY